MNTIVILCLIALTLGKSGEANAEFSKDSPESKLGERFFREPRFAEFFARASKGDVNALLLQGDPALDHVQTKTGVIDHPFKGQTMSCVACHMVGEAAKIQGLGTRTYADFSRRSSIPIRAEDAKISTVRNSPPLVNASLNRSKSFFLHFDGEFTTLQDLVLGGTTGRNFGWLPAEEEIARKQIAKVIREDNGSAPLAREFGGASYARILKGEVAEGKDDYRISPNKRVNIQNLSDVELLDLMAEFESIYLKTLEFSKNEQAEYRGSPYDKFLEKNQLPRKPEAGETDQAYAERLFAKLKAMKNPVFVRNTDGAFKTHNQEFSFAQGELNGLRLFLTKNSSTGKHVSNCVSCHSPPHFTDFSFHNNGSAQEEYDSIHGRGSFLQLPIPTWQERAASPKQFFSASNINPDGVGQFLAVPNSTLPGFTDLGLWNVYGNPAVSKSQKSIFEILCPSGNCNREELLPKTIALFKTSSLRDLGHSAPYFHNGQKDTLQDAVLFYMKMGMLARMNQVRNMDREISKINLNADDSNDLVLFLMSLNEDYE